MKVLSVKGFVLGYTTRRRTSVSISFIGFQQPGSEKSFSGDPAGWIFIQFVVGVHCSQMLLLTFLVCHQKGDTFFFSTRNIQTLFADYNEIHCT